MEDTAHRAVAVVGLGGVLPDAPSIPEFFANVKNGRYSISDVTVDRWDPALYFDPDPKAPDKSYSRIGGWVRSFQWNPMAWHLPIPPKVADAMDDAQKWAVAATREALLSYGHPARRLNLERTAVILGNAMAGEKHYVTATRIFEPEIELELAKAASFAALPEDVRAAIRRELKQNVARRYPEITEDTMPGELANCMAGRIANVFDLHGPNYVCDAACASALAALSAAIEGLVEGDFDVAISGGVDRNMGAPTFVKFCKIGALSATGTRPYADGADGFVMGEGAAIFVLKRLADAERDGDTVYAVIRGVGGASDGKGKGITAPNPVGQRFAIERAWKNAGLDPRTATLVEGHGTSTKVGDVVEVESLIATFGTSLPARSIALGSVKSNIGHLKGAAGAAGLAKAVLSLHEKVLPPSLNCAKRNPNIDFDRSPFFVNTELQEWRAPKDGPRRAAVSAFGFGGTNFHVVLEEHVPGRLVARAPMTTVGAALEGSTVTASARAPEPRAPMRGIAVLGASSASELAERVRTLEGDAKAGKTPPMLAPLAKDLTAPFRIAIDHGSASELADKCAKVTKAMASDTPAAWRQLRNAGVFRGQGPATKVAFLFTGQGSQYANMAKKLADAEVIVRDTFAEADRVMTPLLGRTLTSYVFADPTSPEAVAKAEEDLRQTAITQPAVLAVDTAIARLLGSFGVQPDMVMGHSLGEYGALVASGALPFADALEAVSARGREMTRVSVADCGKMAAIFAPLADIERVLSKVDGYVVIANKNSNGQAVIGGASPAVDAALAAFKAEGVHVAQLNVSHAFHTSIVAPASGPLKTQLDRLRLGPPKIPTIANLTGDFYPMDPAARAEIVRILGEQVASPVEFVKGLGTLYAAGARVFVEVGPKKALHGFAEDVLSNKPDVTCLFTNHVKTDDVVGVSQALAGLYAAGLGAGRDERVPEVAAPVAVRAMAATPAAAAPVAATPVAAAPMNGHLSHGPVSAGTVSGGTGSRVGAAGSDEARYTELGRIFADAIARSAGLAPTAGVAPQRPVVITGAGLGLPGGPKVFGDDNVAKLLHGTQMIDVLPTKLRRAMVDKHIVRLNKSEAGGASFEAIESVADVIKLAGRGGTLDLEEEFGVAPERIAALDVVTRLAMAAGIDALRDAGLPLVLRYKTSTKGTRIPDRYMLPEALRDDTGVIFASAFPGYDSFAKYLEDHLADVAKRQQLADLEHLRARLAERTSDATLVELDRKIDDLRTELTKSPYTFDRRFLFRI
ncbi:type I polyketide synthase, partial [Myxococcota bacterium]|nr:type I polyketide synthase [Myxococcota bacterium]